MRLLFLRHGDPNYVTNKLTEKGRREAELLSEYLKNEPIDKIYMSPLGRAQETASYTLEKKGMTAEVADWLQEFPARLDVRGSKELQAIYNDTPKNPDGSLIAGRIVWDMLPSYWENDPDALDFNKWMDTEPMKKSGADVLYRQVTAEFDKLLAENGYVRDGSMYRVEKGNHQTIAFFCHFGITNVLLSHLWHISPVLLWHSILMPTSSITELYSEEREKGRALFRGIRIGDITHLRDSGVDPFAVGRFCETFEDPTRH